MTTQRQRVEFETLCRIHGGGAAVRIERLHRTKEAGPVWEVDSRHRLDGVMGPWVALVTNAPRTPFRLLTEDGTRRLLVHPPTEEDRVYVADPVRTPA